MIFCDLHVVLLVLNKINSLYKHRSTALFVNYSYHLIQKISTCMSIQRKIYGIQLNYLTAYSISFLFLNGTNLLLDTCMVIDIIMNTLVSYSQFDDQANRV